MSDSKVNIISESLRKQSKSIDGLKLIQNCQVKISHDGKRKQRDVCLTSNAIYIYKQGKLRYQLQFHTVKKVTVALYSTDILLQSKADKSWIIDAYDDRFHIVGYLKKHMKSIRCTDDTFLDGELIRGLKRNPTKQEQSQKNKRNEVLNLKQLKKQFMREQIKEGGGYEHVLQSYHPIATLLANQYWRTYMAYEKGQPNKHFTLKIYCKEKIAQVRTILFYIINECENLKNILSPYVPVLNRFFYTSGFVVMVLDFYEGLLLAELDNQLTDKSIKLLLGQIVMALGHLHECGIVYFDLGPHSVLLNHDGHVLLINVGMSRERMQPITPNSINSSPECMRSLKAEFSTDWWALGILIYQLIEGRHIFSDLSPAKQSEALLSKEEVRLKFTKKSETTYPELIDLIEKLLVKNPEKRLGFHNDYHQVLSHPFFSDISRNELMVKETPIIKNMAIKKKIKDQNINFQTMGKKSIKQFDSILNEHLYNRDLEDF